MPLSAAWERWLAENLLLDVDRSVLLQRLVAEGFEPPEVHAAIESITSHVSSVAAARLVARMKKRDWLLRTLADLQGAAADGERIERRETIGVDEFLTRHYAVNRPLHLTGALRDWPALSRWTPAYFRDRFGPLEVEVQAGRTGNPRYERDSHRFKHRMTMQRFVDQLTSAGESNEVYLTANNGSANAAALRGVADDYSTLPEFLDPLSPDAAGLLWLGPAGTVTPLHHDLTNNALVQIFGRKKVLLASSLALPDIANDQHCYSEVDPEAIDYARHPSLRRVRFHEVLLCPGDLLFIPIGWWHHVRSLDASASITFTNFVFRNDASASYATWGDV